MVKRQQRIVQVGTQHRNEPYPRAAHDLVQTGALGDVTKVEIVGIITDPGGVGAWNPNKS